MYHLYCSIFSCNIYLLFFKTDIHAPKQGQPCPCSYFLIKSSCHRLDQEYMSVKTVSWNLGITHYKYQCILSASTQCMCTHTHTLTQVMGGNIFCVRGRESRMKQNQHKEEMSCAPQRRGYQQEQPVSLITLHSLVFVLCKAHFHFSSLDLEKYFAGLYKFIPLFCFFHDFSVTCN